MSIDIDTARKVAKLARIRVEEADLPKLAGQLSGILGFMEQLNEVDVAGVEPMTSVTPMQLRQREDTIRLSEEKFFKAFHSNPDITMISRLRDGLIVEVNDPEYGLMKQPGPFAWLEECATQMITPRPRRNVSFEQALAELNEVAAAHPATYPIGTAVRPASNAGWLDGLRILDLTNVIAGPHSTAFLARFGAEVIKLDPVKPLYDPLIGTLFTFQTGMGKRSALVDIMSAEGREVFNRLVRSVDMVVINAPERQLKSLGLDHDSLQAVNPGVLFCRLDCLGGPLPGPKTDYIGYDDIIQASTGMAQLLPMVDGNERPRFLPAAIADKVSGLHAVYAVLAAFIHRMRSGEGQRVEVPMFECFASFMLTEHLRDATLDPAIGPAGYPRQLDPTRQPFPTNDGHLAIVPYTPESTARLMALLGSAEACAQPVASVPKPLTSRAPSATSASPSSTMASKFPLVSANEPFSKVH